MFEIGLQSLVGYGHTYSMWKVPTLFLVLSTFESRHQPSVSTVRVTLNMHSFDQRDDRLRVHTFAPMRRCDTVRMTLLTSVMK